MHPKHKKLAVFAHYTGVKRAEGEAGNDIIIVRLDNKWFWIIPISADKTSVGLVIDKDAFAQEPSSPQEVLERYIQSTQQLRERLAKAERVSEIHTTSDFSYFNQRFVGERLLRVGDAAGFMDPIFSAGVFLAMWSGKLAAETILHSLAAGRPDNARFQKYEKRVRHSIMQYWRMVENYYTTPFMELFMRPSEHANLFSAVIALLAGEFEGRWALRWRIEYFFLLVKIQAWLPFSPRIRFGPRKLNPALPPTAGKA